MDLYLKKTKPFLVCVDSDGCVFDTMELKHKECFCPAIIQSWNLQGISRYVREVMGFVNLYSIYRGIHPMRALVRTFAYLRERPEPKRRGVPIPDLSPLETWIEQAEALCDGELEAYCASHKGERILEQTLAWSKNCNQRVREMTRNVPPFPYARSTLEMFSAQADLLVVSTTPGEQLAREWGENGLDCFLAGIGGQEAGDKVSIIRHAISLGYDRENVIMLGDAPGDHRAAEANGIRFYPILAGREEEAWKSLKERVAELFFMGKYTAREEDKQLTCFYERLPKEPPWQE